MGTPIMELCRVRCAYWTHVSCVFLKICHVSTCCVCIGVTVSVQHRLYLTNTSCILRDSTGEVLELWWFLFHNTGPSYILKVSPTPNVSSFKDLNKKEDAYTDLWFVEMDMNILLCHEHRNSPKLRQGYGYICYNICKFNQRTTSFLPKEGITFFIIW